MRFFMNSVNLTRGRFTCSLVKHTKKNDQREAEEDVEAFPPLTQKS